MKKEVGPDSTDKTKDTGGANPPGQVDPALRQQLLEGVSSLPPASSSPPKGTVGDLTLDTSGGGGDIPVQGADPAGSEQAIPGLVDPNDPNWQVVEGGEGERFKAVSVSTETGEIAHGEVPQLDLVERINPGTGGGDGGPGGTDSLRGPDDVAEVVPTDEAGVSANEVADGVNQTQQHDVSVEAGPVHENSRTETVESTPVSEQTESVNAVPAGPAELSEASETAPNEVGTEPAGVQPGVSEATSYLQTADGSSAVSHALSGIDSGTQHHSIGQ
jgi:hypothetical protein